MRGFKTLKAKKETGKRQPDANSPVSVKLATDNWQPDANSSFDGLRRLKLNREPANGVQMFIYYHELAIATGSQMPIRFYRKKQLKLNRKSAIGSQMSNH